MPSQYNQKAIADMTQMEFEEYIITAGIQRFLHEQQKGTQKVTPDGRRVAVQE